MHSTSPPRLNYQRVCGGQLAARNITSLLPTAAAPRKPSAASRSLNTIVATENQASLLVRQVHKQEKEWFGHTSLTFGEIIGLASAESIDSH